MLGAVAEAGWDRGPAVPGASPKLSASLVEQGVPPSPTRAALGGTIARSRNAYGATPARVAP
ncbi:hypothetical protein GCM10010309_33060 [Streptomyces violaceochromogenes]|nr:hypothetical protein GCM10010309_33060 [Streptomyces violaceochromogenes]